ncbi:MAG: AarF/UbiB family protein [Thalassobaculum sp.]|uniref:ABC1 kinase family protein n=1 Tax=Thalassobaculum sp. TaxID=2022740 RepID=UPI0032EC04B7
MLDETLLPTLLERAKERQPVEIREPDPEPRFAFARVLGSFGGHILGCWFKKLAGRSDPDAEAVRLRQVFENLGGLWIKIGQLASLRTDVFSEPTCRELARLQHQAIGFPLPLVEDILRQVYGAELDSIFQYFSEEPIAAASISQVHLALLREPNVVVAVKVRRPTAERSFLRDLRHIKRLIGIIDFLGIGEHLHLDDALWELEQMVREELDFRFEAANTKRMRKSLKDHNVYVPRVFRSVSNRLVLVTEFIDGVLMSDFIRIGQNDPKRVEHWCRVNNVDPEKVGKRLFRSVLRQILEDNLFHADVHPGNIILLRDSRFVLIDFGTIGFCEREMLANYKVSLQAMAQKDFGKAAEVMLRLAIAPPSLGDVKNLRRDLVRTYRDWEGRTHLTGVGYHERSLGAAGAEAGRIMTRYRVTLSWAFMRINRTWTTMDASLSYLIPNANYIELFSGYFEASRRRHMAPRRVLRGVVSTVGRVASRVDEYNAALEQLVRRQQLYSTIIGSTSERIVRAITTFLRFVRLMLTLAFSAGLVSFVILHHDSLVPEHEPIFLDRFAKQLEGVPYEWWWVILTVLIAANFAFKKIVRRLENRP